MTLKENQTHNKGVHILCAMTSNQEERERIFLRPKYPPTI